MIIFYVAHSFMCLKYRGTLFSLFLMKRSHVLVTVYRIQHSNMFKYIATAYDCVTFSFKKIDNNKHVEFPMLYFLFKYLLSFTVPRTLINNFTNN